MKTKQHRQKLGGLDLIDNNFFSNFSLQMGSVDPWFMLFLGDYRVSGSPGNLVEMQFIGPYPRSTKSQSLGGICTLYALQFILTHNKV